MFTGSRVKYTEELLLGRKICSMRTELEAGLPGNLKSRQWRGPSLLLPETVPSTATNVSSAKVLTSRLTRKRITQSEFQILACHRS